MSDINRPARPYVSIQHQPWKAIYMTKTLISVLFFQLPFYAITQLLFRSARPHPDFTFAQAMVVRIVRFMGLFRRADWYSDRWTVEKLSKYTNAKSESLGRLLAKAVWVPKLDGALQGEAGQLEKRAGTRSVRTHGWWFAIPSSLDSHGNAAQWRELFDEEDVEKAAVARIKAAKGEQVLLYFHGGGYLERSAGPKSQTTAVPRQLLKKIEEHLAQGYEGDAKLLPRKAFSLEYRLSDKTSFSGILADAVSSWRYLVEDCEYEPENIYVGGDSAGGHLSLALTRYIRDVRPFGKSGMPRGLMLYSPWVDASLSYGTKPNASHHLNAPYDILSLMGLATASSELLRGVAAGDEKSLYISSLHLGRESPVHDYKGFPPLIVMGGSLEKFIDEIRDLAKAYKKDVQADQTLVHSFEDKKASHDPYNIPICYAEVQKVGMDRNLKWLLKLNT